MTDNERTQAEEILQNNFDNPKYSIWEASLAAMQDYAAIKVAEATKGMYPKKFLMWVINMPPDDYSRLLSQINFSGMRPNIDELFEYWKQNIQGK